MSISLLIQRKTLAWTCAILPLLSLLGCPPKHLSPPIECPLPDKPDTPKVSPEEAKQIAEEERVGRECYIPGENDYLGRENQRALKNLPAQYTSISNFIQELQNTCAALNQAVSFDTPEEKDTIRKAQFDNFYSIITDGIGITYDNVDRDNVLAAYSVQADNDNYISSVSFSDGIGLDQDGLTREFLTFISEQFKSAYLLTPTGNGSAYDINPEFRAPDPDALDRKDIDFTQCGSPAQGPCYYTVGQMIAKTVFVEKQPPRRDNKPNNLDVALSKFLLWKLLGKEFQTLQEYLAIMKLDDPEKFNQIMTVLSESSPEELYLEFTNDTQQNIEASAENIYNYALWTIKNTLDGNAKDIQTHENPYAGAGAARKIRLDNLLAGFFSKVPAGEWQSTMNANTLDLVLRGDLQISPTYIMQHITVYNPPTATEDAVTPLPLEAEIYTWLREIIEEESAKQADFIPRLLAFWTASQTLSPSDRLNVFFSSADVDKFPTAHTCSYQLDIPRYPSKETLQEKLVYAVYNSSGFDFR